MSMIGKRVHVTRFNRRDVDFYATLEKESENFYILTQCSDGDKSIRRLSKKCRPFFGKNNVDYYEVINDKKNEKDKGDLMDMERVKKELKVLEEQVQEIREFLYREIVENNSYREIIHLLEESDYQIWRK